MQELIQNLEKLFGYILVQILMTVIDTLYIIQLKILGLMVQDFLQHMLIKIYLEILLQRESNNTNPDRNFYRIFI